MSDRTWNRVALASAIVLSATVLPATTMACCPSGGNGATATATGLGQSFPIATNLSSDPAWAIYRFTRSGITHTQVNDSAGVVRAEVGNIGSTAWVLPAGVDADRVLLPGDFLPAGTSKVLYKSAALEVRSIQAADGMYWLIAPTDAAP